MDRLMEGRTVFVIAHRSIDDWPIRCHHGDETGRIIEQAPCFMMMAGPVAPYYRLAAVGLEVIIMKRALAPKAWPWM